MRRERPTTTRIVRPSEGPRPHAAPRVFSSRSLSLSPSQPTMFLALHRSLVDAPFFAQRLAPEHAPAASDEAEPAEARAAAATVAALAEPVAASAAETGAAHHCSSLAAPPSPSSPSPSLVLLAGGLAACVATDPATRFAEADAPPVLRAAALVVGAFDNEAEVAREYSLELETGNPTEDDLAAMVLDLYGRNFEDESGDSSDEPAALLGMLSGSWAIALVGERPTPRAGGGTATGLHVVVARSSGLPPGRGVGGGGGETERGGRDDDDEEDEPLRPPPPLYWGTSGECLVVSSTPQEGLSPFPAGCFYESTPSPPPAQTSGRGGGERAFRIDQFCRTAASAKTREVVVSAASSGGGGGGSCGALRYKSKSGKDICVNE